MRNTVNRLNSNMCCGCSIFTVLTIIFVVLKLTHVIDWSWWWVLSPSLIGIGLWGIMCIFIVVALIFVTWK